METLTAKIILDDFERLGARHDDSMSQTLQLRRQNPEALADLAIGAMHRALPPGFSATLGAALDLMDDASFGKVANAAWNIAVGPGRCNDSIARVLDMAALQLPEVFASDWNRLLELAIFTYEQTKQPSRRLYHAQAAWRALDAATVQDWLRQLECEPVCEGTARDRATALLYSHHPQAVLYAWKRMFPHAQDQAVDSLMSAGYTFDAKTGGLRVMHSESPLFIAFDPAQRKLMQQDLGKWKREIWTNHPTWQPQPFARRSRSAEMIGHVEPKSAVTNAEMRAHETDGANGENGVRVCAYAWMGGALAHRCGFCHEPLHRLLSFDQPAQVGIASLTPITLGTCLSCQGWEGEGGPMFYRHDADGEPRPHPALQFATAITPQFPVGALHEAKVGLFAAPARWNRQDWAGSNGRQNLSRVGGAPSWVQSAWYPACPDCGVSMPFVMQLDSDLPLADGGAHLWGSGGCNYTFWCANCRVSAHVWQCT